jgi:hypothetical protein
MSKARAFAGAVDRCDVIVATIAAGDNEPAAQEAAALEFLNSDLVLHWAQTSLGL